VTAGSSFACGTHSGGNVMCWGESSYGKRTPPTPLTALAVSSGHHHACAIRSDGTLVCWGDSAEDQSAAPAGVFWNF
jgi:hypothetical protein